MGNNAVIKPPLRALFDNNYLGFVQSMRHYQKKVNDRSIFFYQQVDIGVA
jgi:hypothetical protein